LPRRMRLLIDLGGTAQDFFRTALSQIVFENLIWIVEIAENQIEAAEIISQAGWKLPTSREETGERSVFNRSNSIGVKSFISEGCDMWVTKDLDLRPRMGVAQRFQRRQSQEEIAKRAAANDENAFNNGGMRERLASRHRQNQKRLRLAIARWFC
jgi:ABC-type sulfate/molybdate transport systems ATPase subunit